MRKWLLILMMTALLVFPSFVSAQAGLSLTNVEVQLWPEYDQPSMLVIVDYTISPMTPLPVDVKFRIPQDANLIAVANYGADGKSLLNAVFENPTKEGDWQVFTVTLDSMRGRFEYYQPIAFNGDKRTFSYLWDNTYAVNAFTVSVLEPLDVTSLTTTPKLALESEQQGIKYHNGTPVKLAANEQFVLTLEYDKTSSALIASSSAPSVQPVEPLDENTAGRVSLSNSLPYIIGGLGVLMVAGGVYYYLQSGKTSSKKSRARRHVKSNEESGSDVYCAQCGTRARGADRFCRTCGSRLRQSED